MQIEETELQQILNSISELKTEVEGFNNKFDNYQKANQSVVNLAFSLIASATVLSIVYRVFPR